MSRIGTKPISIPEGVEVTIVEQTLKAKGPKGELSLEFPEVVKLEKGEKDIKVTVEKPKELQQKVLWGTYAALTNNIIIGVSKGFEKKLEIQGVGYGWSVQGKKLELKVGFSHPVEMEIPEGLEAKAEKSILTISGINKEDVGTFAANIRKVRPPEPYKGKGIRYVDEYVRRKVGKQAVGAEE